MDLYSHQPKGAKLTEASSTVRRKTPSFKILISMENFSAGTVASSGCQSVVALSEYPP